MIRPSCRGLRWLLASALLFFAMFSVSAPAASASKLFVVTIDGSINPASAAYLIGAIERAEAEEATAILIELDTPGGLVS
ncbi:MAG: nodulation protein NfeD, partial [Myxococcota bacterium]